MSEEKTINHLQLIDPPRRVLYVVTSVNTDGNLVSKICDAYSLPLKSHWVSYVENEDGTYTLHDSSDPIISDFHKNGFPKSKEPDSNVFSSVNNSNITITTSEKNKFSTQPLYPELRPSIQVKFLNEDVKEPESKTDFAAGYDLFSTETYNLQSLERKVFKTGISMAIPDKMYGRISPRSGLAVKNGIDVLAGVIDSDYRGEIGVVLINLSNDIVTISKGDRIAQIIFQEYHKVNFNRVIELPDTKRGSGGYGSTGA